MKQKISIVILIVIVFQLLQIVYAKRAYFTEVYDAEYWKDRFEHSQYQLPLTKRLIGDDGIYGYAGYKVIHGADPFSIVVDKPPFGKYIIGASIVLWNNPNVISLVLGVGTLILLFLISRIVLSSALQALVVSALFSVDAMFFSQLWISAMDMAQLFFFLLSLTLISHPFLSGIALGLFAEIKPPILLPIIIPLLFFWMRKIKPVLIWIAGFVIGALLPYIWYVHLGYSLLDIVRVHKFMFSLIRSSSLPVHFTAMIETIFLGRFPQISSGIPTIVTEWWPVWPGIVVVSALAWFRKKDTFRWGLLSFSFLSLLVFSIIPSYPRYLLVILPFFYLIAVSQVFRIFRDKIAILIVCGVLVLGLIRTALYVRPSSDSFLSVCLNSYTHQFFADVYEECLDSESKRSMTRSEFRVLAQQTFSDAEIVNIVSKKVGPAVFDITYTTIHLGTFTERKTIPLVRENGQWRLRWNWGLLVDGFRPDDRLVSTITYGKRGSIYRYNGEIQAQDRLGSLVSVNPSRIDTKRENDMLNVLSTISSVWHLALQNQYLENPLPNQSVPLFSIFEPMATATEQSLRSFPGVVISPARTRFYAGRIGGLDVKNTMYPECCTRIYSSLNYHGARGIEAMYDKQLSGYDGGTLRIVDNNGKTVRTIIEKVPKNGQDIINTIF